MTNTSPATGATAAPQMPTPVQIRQELSTYNLGTEVMDAFDSFIAENNINPNEPMTQERALMLMEALDKAAPRPTVVAPPAQEPPASATTRGLPAHEPASPEVAPPAPEAAPPSAVYSEKAFRKDTPEKIRQKASNGSLSADEAKMWATTTTKEGRALLGISGRMDASDRAKLSRRNLDRKRAEREESPEAASKSGGNFIGRAARGVANAVTWPVRGLMKLFGAKDAAEKLRLASPSEASQPVTTRGAYIAERDGAIQESLEEQLPPPPPQPRIEESSLPPLTEVGSPEEPATTPEVDHGPDIIPDIAPDLTETEAKAEALRKAGYYLGATPGEGVVDNLYFLVAMGELTPNRWNREGVASKPWDEQNGSIKNMIVSPLSAVEGPAEEVAATEEAAPVVVEPAEVTEEGTKTPAE